MKVVELFFKNSRACRYIKYRGQALLIPFILLISSSFAHAQNKSHDIFFPSLDPDKKIHQYVHNVWTMEDGLPSNSIWSITQCTDGYLWLGTYHGLVRFDGVNFKTFDRSNTKVFNNNKIKQVLADNNGGLWILTYDNLLIRSTQNKFKLQTAFDSLQCGVISTIFQDKQKRIWIGCTKGVVLFENGAYRHLQNDLLQVQVRSICEDENGTIYFAAHEKGIIKLKNGHFSLIDKSNGLPSNSIHRIVADDIGGLWILNYDLKIFYYNKSHSKLIAKYTWNDQILIDRSGQIWISEVGIKRINKETHKVEHFFNSDGLADNRVRALFEDREGNLWVGSYAGGLERFKNSPIKVLTKKDGLLSEKIYSVYEDQNGTLWAGNNIGYIHKISADTISETHFLGTEYFEANQTVYANTVNSFCEDHLGNLWIGTNLGLFTQRNGNFIRELKEEQIFIKSILAPSFAPGTLIIGTAHKGLLIYKDGKIESLIKPKLIDGYIIRVIYEDPEYPGGLWIGTNKELIYYTSDSMRIFKESEAGFPLAIQQIIHQVNGDIWMATSGSGLVRLHNGTFSRIITDNGLYDDIIWSVREDKYDRVWFSSDRGLSSVYKQELQDVFDGTKLKLESTLYGISEGLKSTEFIGGNLSVTEREGENQLIYPNIHGIAILDLDIDNSEQNPPPIYIQEIKINGNTFSPDSLNKFSKRSENIEFHYNAIRFSNPEKTNFQFKLEGFDQEWKNVGNRRIAYYPKLPSGTYTFKVKANNKIDGWETVEAEYRFSRLPWFYETLIFKILVVLFLVYLIYMVFYLRFRSIKRRNTELEVEITERIRAQSALEESEKKLTHLRNYLSNIINSMPSALIGLNMECKVTQWNLKAEKYTGKSSKEAIGKAFIELVPHLDSEMEKILLAIETKEVQLISKRPFFDNDRTVFEDITIYPLIENGVQGVVIRIDDVSDRVHIEEMMVQSEKMLSVGGLAAGMAHEINNPLAGMIQTANVLANRLGKLDIPANLKAAEDAGTSIESIKKFILSREIPRMIQTINESGKRVATIVENMLSFARTSDARKSSHLLSELVDKTLELAATDFDLKKHYDFRLIEIQKEYEKNLPMLPCEAGKIQQVILNILHNGSQAMQKSGTENPKFIIRIKHDQQNGNLIVEIKDNGPGMNEETLKRVFEPFYTTKPVGEGTGLGLSVSYFIITENHGGEMWAESKPGEGANFLINLPLERRDNNDR